MRQTTRLLFALLALLALAQPLAAADGRAPFDAGVISGLGIRNIGSAAMSGRIAAILRARAGRQVTVFVGAASGGVWKSTMAAPRSSPVFDKQTVQSIGAVAIDPTNPKTVWVGTGESWTRNCVSVGDGVYKSTDGGELEHVGLPESERITTIAVHPTDGNRLRRARRASSGATRPSAASTRRPTAERLGAVLKGREPVHRLSLRLPRPDESRIVVRRHCGTSAARLDLPLRRRVAGGAERQRPVQVDRRRRATWTELDDTAAQGLADEAVGPGRRCDRAVGSEARLRLRRDAPRSALFRLGRRRRDVGGARPQPDAWSGGRSTSRTSSWIRRTRSASSSRAGR